MFNTEVFELIHMLLIAGQFLDAFLTIDGTNGS